MISAPGGNNRVGDRPARFSVKNGDARSPRFPDGVQVCHGSVPVCQIDDGLPVAVHNLAGFRFRPAVK